MGKRQTTSRESQPRTVKPAQVGSVSVKEGVGADQLILHGRPDLPAVWADHVKFLLKRSKTTNAPVMAGLSFFQGDPDQPNVGYEVARIAMSVDLAKAMVNVVNKVIQNSEKAEDAPRGAM